jgi:hypothetical protein
MNADSRHLDQTDDDLLMRTFSDEALEAAGDPKPSVKSFIIYTDNFLDCC